jgi:hypothetical protein
MDQRYVQYGIIQLHALAMLVQHTTTPMDQEGQREYRGIRQLPQQPTRCPCIPVMQPHAFSEIRSSSEHTICNPDLIQLRIIHRRSV